MAEFKFSCFTMDGLEKQEKKSYWTTHTYNKEQQLINQMSRTM